MVLNGPDIADAYGWAARLHRAQVDKLGEPYIWHVLRVAAAVRERGPAYEIAAALHDAVEDTGLTVSQVADRFGVHVARAVDALTKRPREPADQYLERVRRSMIALAVKRADSADNLARVDRIDDEATRERLRAKYERNLLAL